MTTPSPTLRPGDQFASTTCTTRVVVVLVPAERAPVIACGGSPMVAATAGAKAGAPRAPCRPAHRPAGRGRQRDGGVAVHLLRGWRAVMRRRRDDPQVRPAAASLRLITAPANS